MTPDEELSRNLVDLTRFHTLDGDLIRKYMKRPELIPEDDYNYRFVIHLKNIDLFKCEKKSKLILARVEQIKQGLNDEETEENIRYD